MAQFSTPTGLIANKGIELLTFGTPNGFKVAILLEELKEAYGIEYTTQTIDIYENVQKQAWYTKLSPNGRIPTIVDHDKGGYAVFEGAAILNYLTRHYDPDYKFSFEDAFEACTCEQWVAWLHAGLGPMQAQANFSYRFHPERHPFHIQRFVGEVERNYGVLDARLADRDYIAGAGRGRYSIADIAVWPFADVTEVGGVHLSKFPNVYAWWERVWKRSAVKKGMCVPSGEPFRFGQAKMQEMKEADPKGWEEREGPLREALKSAQKEFGYVYKSP
ncbi:glutathione S-transferase [Lophium mytilinum]|uniref:Glutathione S-transferase n=1 Tax=Lophium mytilinum TaxID=390894 RepID=A0A6A6QRW7_9PEZI|nr:glutathione S-transferase [Lophium mytilinum]